VEKRFSDPKMKPSKIGLHFRIIFQAQRTLTVVQGKRPFVENNHYSLFL